MWIRDDDTFIGQFFEATGDRFEIEHLEEALRHVVGRRCALDVGAHYGSWTRRLAAEFDRVIAFEPVPDTYACLARNLEGALNAQVRNQAVGETAGSVTVSVGKMYTHPGMETIVGDGPIPKIAIDDLALEHLDFLKVDVEGYELFVLQGAEQTLRRCRPVVILEENVRGPLEHAVPNGSCETFLAALGARLIATRNKDLIFAWTDPAADRAAFVAQFEGAELASPHEDLRLPIVGFIGRDLDAGEPEVNLIGGGYPSAGSQPFKVVSFYTVGNGYDAHAARLRASLDRFGVAHDLEVAADDVSWSAVCAYKARFLLRKWRESDVPIVWLDADAVLEQPPALFAALVADFAAHKWTWEPDLEDFGHELTSGTLYFGKTALAGRLLEQWARRCEADPDTWDQLHLSAAWCDVSALAPLRTLWLPRAYLQIDGAPEIEPAVVRHLQASRAEKARRGPGEPQFEPGPLGREDRRRNRLWRTPEQAFWVSEGVDHIIPDTGDEFPEGFDVGAALVRALGADTSVLEFGCGVGRIAALFAPERYRGVDINPNAVAAARARNPGHDIRIWDNGQLVPPTDALLFYTVLLHVSDEALVPLLLTLCEGRDFVVIAELMDSRWRRDGDPPVFNRDPEEYILTMDHLGFDLCWYEKRAYARYDQPPWNTGKDSRITFLKFVARAGAA